MTLRHCFRRGLLVSGNQPICSHPSEYYDELHLETMGCSNLSCRRCKSTVRQGVGFSPDRRRFDAAVAYRTEDWNSLPWMSATGGKTSFRFYMCLCTQYVASLPIALKPAAEDESPRPPWACAGHPVTPLPSFFEGKHIEVDSDAEQLVDCAFRGFPHPRFTPECAPEAALVRLYVRLHGEPLQARVAEAIGQRLRSPEVNTRSTALRFFSQCPENPAWPALVDALRGNRSLYRGIQDPTARVGQTLEHRLADCVARRVRRAYMDGRGDLEALELLRWEARFGEPEPVLSTLVQTDLDVLMVRVPEILRRRPDVAYRLLIGLGAWEIIDRGERAVAWVREGVMPEEAARRYIEASYLSNREALLAALDEIHHAKET